MGDDASDGDDRDSGDAQTPEDSSAHPYATRELVAAWLLLLIEHHASYGYDLRRALDDHEVHTDAATLYRVLRKLEDSGWLESRWLRPALGPRRRLYRVTHRGRRNLEDVTKIIRSTRDTHDAFLRLYAR